MKMNSQKNNTLEANLEEHRISYFQTIAKKLVKLEAGYVGDLNFMDGSPNMFWICKESPGLSKLQDYLNVCYSDKVGDGGGELGAGSPVLAKYSIDGRYYRARVQEVVLQEDDPGDSMYSVCYVDYGNSELVSGLELMTWHPRLEALPEQAVACCLEDAPALWREESRATWTLEQLEAFQRTMRRGQLKVRLRTDLGQDRDPREARFEALVWLEGESLLQILKRQSVFADDLASWEQVYHGLDSEMAKMSASTLSKVKTLQRVKLQPEGLPSDAGISLKSPLQGGAAIRTQQSLVEGKFTESNAMTVPARDTIPDVETPGSPVNSKLLDFSKMKVEAWLNKFQENSSSKTVPSVCVEESNGADDVHSISECNSANVSFAKPDTI